MIAILIICGFPVLFGLSAANEKFDKAWIFFCSSILSFYLAINLLSVTIPLAEKTLGKNSLCIFLLAMTAVGLLSALILNLLLSRILSKDVRFPDKYTSVLQFVLGYCGALLQVVLLIFGTAPFLAGFLPGVTADLMKVSSAITQQTMFLCQKEMTDHQKNWIRYWPLSEKKSASAASPAEKSAAASAQDRKKAAAAAAAAAEPETVSDQTAPAETEDELKPEVITKERFSRPFSSGK